MEKQRSHFFNVPEGVPEEFVPLMAAYMSYFLQTGSSRGNHNARVVKRANGLIWRLAVFLEVDDNSSKYDMIALIFLE